MVAQVGRFLFARGRRGPRRSGRGSGRPGTGRVKRARAGWVELVSQGSSVPDRRLRQLALQLQVGPHPAGVDARGKKALLRHASA